MKGVLIVLLLLVVSTACGSSGGDDPPAATTGTSLTVTMAPDAAPDDKEAAIDACDDRAGFGKVTDAGREATTFQVDLSGSTYEQQVDIVSCLGDQAGVQSARGNK